MAAYIKHHQRRQSNTPQATNSIILANVYHRRNALMMSS